MKLVVLSDDYVQKVNFIIASFERDMRIHAPFNTVLYGIIDASYNAVASHVANSIRNASEST